MSPQRLEPFNRCFDLSTIKYKKNNMSPQSIETFDKGFNHSTIKILNNNLSHKVLNPLTNALTL